MRLSRFTLCSILIMLAILALSIAYAELPGVRGRRPRPHEYGNVLIDNYSSIGNIISPVVFKHWLHRSRYTCRLCHMDIGFAMSGGQTKITCDDIKNGLYCGACHNGDESFPRIEKQPGRIQEVYNCILCHSHGKDVTFKYDFYEFKKRFPRERFGNDIDWLKAEEDNIITLKDFLDNVSVKRRKFEDPEELQVSAEEAVMPDIIFSHKKHAVWSGCELCHPDIFGVTTEGRSIYGMGDIFNGKYCGACHGIVAFPNQDCQRCHTKEVY